MLPGETEFGGGKSRLWTWDFTLLLFISFLAFIVCQALNNGFPLYITGLGGTTAFAGMFILDFSVFAAVARIFVGRVIDRYGRRQMMITGAMLLFAGTALSIVLYDSAQLFVLRALQGIGFACITTSCATAATDVIPGQRLGEGVGYFSLGQSLGMAIGPSFGVLLTTFVFKQSLFVGAAAIAAVCVICTCCSNYERNPERLPRTSAYRVRCEAAGGVEALRRTMIEPQVSGGSEKLSSASVRHPVLSSLFVKSALCGALPMFLAQMAFSIVVSYTALFATQRGIVNPGLFFVFAAISMTVIRLAASSLFDRVRPRVLYLFVIVCGAAMFLFMAMAQTTVGLCISGVFFGLSMGVSMPLLNSVAIKNTVPERWGAANAMLLIMVDVGVGVGAVIWGRVIDIWGFSAAFIGGTVCFVLTYIVALIVFPRWKPAEAPSEEEPSHR